MNADRALLVTLEAKPGKGDELAAFLARAQPMAVAEEQTVSWVAFRISDTTFGIFDTFADEEGRQAHIDGAIAAAMVEEGPALFAKRPDVQRPLIVAMK